MEKQEILEYCINSLQDKGADKVQCRLIDKEKQELYFNADKLSMLRTTYDTNLHLTAIIENRKGNITLNKVDKESLDKAIADTINLARSSEPDEANDISNIPANEVVSKGPMKADLDSIYDRLNEFLREGKEKYPITNLEEGGCSYNKVYDYYLNSNGVSFQSTTGDYDFGLMFTSKDGKKTSSFNYSQFSTRELNKKFLECATFDTLLQQSGEQIDAQSLTEKFTGDILITPDCLLGFIFDITNHLHDYSHITGTSLFKDKLDKLVSSPQFTLRSNPVSEELAEGYAFTNDGFKAENLAIIEKGILKSFLLSLYGANKTGKEKAVNQGGNYVVDAGDQSFEEMVKSTKKGILLCRFSGGQPNDNGDFAGVAKNSYLIEDGEIKYPINETMISANILKLLENITEISKERVNFGYSILPWVKVKDIAISGK